jgi:hypothetical protein
MQRFKITYKLKLATGWQVGYKIVEAYDLSHAIQVADLWHPLIKKVERI